MGAAASKTRTLPRSAAAAVKQIKPDVKPTPAAKDEDFLSKAISMGIVQVESKPQILSKTHSSVTHLENRRKLEAEHEAMTGKKDGTLRSFEESAVSSRQRYANTAQLTAMIQDSSELSMSEFCDKYQLDEGFVKTLTPLFNRSVRLPTLRAELPDDWETHQTSFAVRRIRKGEYNPDSRQQGFKDTTPLLAPMDEELQATDMSQTLDTTLMNMLDNGEGVNHFQGQGMNGGPKTDEFARGRRLQSQIKEVKRVL